MIIHYSCEFQTLLASFYIDQSGRGHSGRPVPYFEAPTDCFNFPRA